MYVKSIFYLFVLHTINFQKGNNNLSNIFQLVSCLNTKENILLLFLFTLVVLLLLNKKLSVYVYCILTLLVFLPYQIQTNTTQYMWFLQNTQEININLTNGILLIHPILLYTVYALIITQSFFVGVLKKKIPKYTTVFAKHNMISYIMVITIMLGCYWAEQELSWGGWWSWDFVELLAVSIYIYTNYVLHKKVNKTDTHVYIYYNVTIVFLSIIVVRFNLINSIHNFILTTNTAQHLNYVLGIVLFILLYTVYTKYKQHMRINISVQSQINNNATQQFFILMLVLYILQYLVNILNVDIFIDKSTVRWVFYTLLYIFTTYYIFVKNWFLFSFTAVILILAAHYNLTLLDVVQIVFLCLVLLNKNVKESKIVHIVIVCSLFFVLHQTLTFSNIADFVDIKLVGIYNVKSTYFTNNTSTLSVLYLFWVKIQTFVVDMFITVSHTQAGNKDIFEKNFIFSNQIQIKEFYSCSDHIYVQYNMVLIPILCLLLLLHYRKKTTFKKKFF